jgi:hypothetical protein
MTLNEQIELATQTRNHLEERRARSKLSFGLRFAFSSASTLVGAALATAKGAKDELIARGALAGMLGQAALQLGQYQVRHPEHHDEIGNLPGMLAEIANDVRA